MPIKSLFVPDYALQGEDVPLHVIWDALELDHIEIALFPGFSVKEIFNAEYECSEDSKRVIIRKIEMDGYVGGIFGSKTSDQPSYQGKLVFSFFNKEGRIISQETREIKLFRYHLIIGKLPKVIRVDVRKKFVHNRIPIYNKGRGTVLIVLLTSNDSDVKKVTPSSVEEVRQKLLKDLNDSLSRVRGKFKPYSGLIQEYLSYSATDWKSYKDIKKGKMLAEKISRCFNESEEFFKAFWNAFDEALSKNINIRTIPDRLLRYLNSLATRKTILLNPEDMIEITNKSQTLKLELLPTDLLLDESDIISFPPLKIVGTKRGEIEIFKLFEWKEEE